MERIINQLIPKTDFNHKYLLLIGLGGLTLNGYNLFRL